MTGAMLFEKDLSEYFSDGTANLTESEVAGKTHRVVEGTAAKAGIVNRNKRLYPERVFEKTLNTYVNAKVAANKFLGELEHPDEIRSSLSRAAVKFTEVWKEGADIKYRAIILPTPAGKILEQLLEAGVAVGVSTRGAGSYKFEKVGGEEVEVIQDDYRMTGIDFVLDESNPYGAISKFESTEGGHNVDIKTVEQLKAHFPELATQLEESARSEGAAAKETELNGLQEAALEQAKQEAVDTYKASEEAKQYETAFNAIVEAMKPHLPETVRIAESELGKEVTDLRASLKTKEAEAIDAKAKLTEAQGKLAKIEDAKKLAEAIEAKVAGHKFESLLRQRLSELATADEVDAKFDKEVTFLESVTALKGEDVPAGSGIVHQKEDPKEPKKPLNESLSKLTRLAGLN